MIYDVLLLMLCTFFKGLFALFCHFFKGLLVAKKQNFLLKGKGNSNYFLFKRKVVLSLSQSCIFNSSFAFLREHL